MVTFLGQEAADDALGVGVLLFLAGLAVALFVLWVAAVVSVLRHPRLTGGGKFLWILVIIGFPLLGSIGWFVVGRDAQLVKSAVGPPASTMM
ncbi:PLDc N-terminal domain-containing protein [Saccharothrix sp. CCNWYY140]|uniref:PLDc N-terminal domain-containing protein n=1 Tax=unclassified Saccharothrix TaxID=2593673 RepID=UPI003FD240D7